MSEFVSYVQRRQKFVLMFLIDHQHFLLGINDRNTQIFIVVEGK